MVSSWIVRRTRKDWMHSVDYKYTGEWTLYAGILGREEELNNYGMDNTWG